MTHGHTSVGRQSYVRIKLQQDTHALWVELKASFKLKSDDALACYLLTSTGTMGSNRQVDESITMTP